MKLCSFPPKTFVFLALPVANSWMKTNVELEAKFGKLANEQGKKYVFKKTQVQASNRLSNTMPTVTIPSTGPEVGRQISHGHHCIVMRMARKLHRHDVRTQGLNKKKHLVCLSKT